MCGLAAEADAIGTQFWPCETRARQKHYRKRRIRAGGCTRLTQLLRLLHHQELLT